MATAPLIELDQVSKSFDGGRTFALRDVSLAVEAGAFIALVGASGSGKTTAMKTDQPAAGAGPRRGARRRHRGSHPRCAAAAPADRLRVPGCRPVSAHDDRARTSPSRRSCWAGHAPRSTPASPNCSTSSNLPQRLCRPPAAGAVGRPAPARRRCPRARGTATRGADGRAVRRPRPGHPRRARDRAIARCTSGSALTTIMVTHDVQEAVLLADRIVVMGGGRILADGCAGPRCSPAMRRPTSRR